MTHAEMSELYELYVLGALEREPAQEIDQHLRDNCAHCQEQVREALETTAAMAAMAEQVRPPKALRERVVSSVRPARHARTWAFTFAALAAACVALVVVSLWSRGEVQRMRGQVAALTGERNELRSAVEVLTTADTRAIKDIRAQLIAARDERNRLRSLLAVVGRPDTRVVEFGRAANAPRGRVFVNGAGGLVFVGTQLPALASDRAYELWLIPSKGAPEAAGVFQPGSTGESLHVSPVPVGRSTAAIAVTVEPRQGSSAPTTKPFLVVPLG